MSTVTIRRTPLSGRRSDIKIIVEILSVALHDAKKTEIVYKANLNFKQMQRYLDFLMGKGLIADCGCSSGKRKYQTTERGRTFLKRYMEISDIVS
jgi:predicted transcriptional regulator